MAFGCRCRSAIGFDRSKRTFTPPDQLNSPKPPNAPSAPTCATLASLDVMTTDLTDQLEGSHRKVALAIQQLAVLAEMFINRALDNLDSPESSVKPVCH